ncbi:expressed unknown protein [Seminavis robusta]|uniref:Uncharacterized protein n=1 Tax=Seminavis robusta TaxID=568900 RepID=A0A9N8HZ26_9STRA|nr:expressed unknown protein [Seminavis robusta]|eukprot:Sro2747_g336151.1  (103) ;mRNA; f:7335-7643
MRCACRCGSTENREARKIGAVCACFLRIKPLPRQSSRQASGAGSNEVGLPRRKNVGFSGLPHSCKDCGAGHHVHRSNTGAKAKVVTVTLAGGLAQQEYTCHW